MGHSEPMYQQRPWMGQLFGLGGEATRRNP